MDQLKKLLTSLTVAQRISIAVMAVLVGVALWGLTRWKHESDFKPLYTGMAAADAGPVVQKLKESGVEYRLSENGTAVLVPSERIAELRLELAAAGLPKTGRLGFELFDKNSFGVTDFVEQVNYHRALEGELERSVMSLAEVEQARVHVTFPKDSVFVESRQPAKASVMVRLRPGAILSPQNVTAVCHLVSSAVEGLAPDAVSVLDMNGNLLGRPRNKALGDAAGLPDNLLEFRHEIEKDLVAKISSTLEPLLGPDKFRAGASVECDFSSAEQSEETYDPNRSVKVTSQKTEDASAGGIASGMPGTASNLPNPRSRPATGSNGATRRTENITYQSSRVVKHTRLPQGIVKRISLAVLVDNNVRWDGVGKARHRVLVPPPPETLKSIRDLVAAAAGLNTERGDQLIIESLPFDSTINVEPVASPAPSAHPRQEPALLDAIRPYRQIIILGAVALLVLVFVAWRVLAANSRRSRQSTVAQQPALEAPSATAAAPARLGVGHPDTAATAAVQAPSAHPALPAANAEDLVQALREAISKKPSRPTDVVRSWLEEGHA